MTQLFSLPECCNIFEELCLVFFYFFFRRWSVGSDRIKDLSKLLAGSPATAISNDIGFQLQASGLYSSLLKPGPIRFLKLIQYIFNRGAILCGTLNWFC